jgi:PAS domain S-box-containing protein
MTSMGPTRDVGLLYPAFGVYFLVAWTTALTVFVVKWRRARGVARIQLHYLALGFLIAGAGGISTNLVLPLFTGRTEYNWVGPHFALVFVALVAHAIIRHRLMDLRLVIHRGLTLAIAVLVSLLPVAVFLTFAWPRLSLHLEPQELMVMLAAIGVVSLLIPVIRDIAGRLLDRYVYRTHANYQRTVREASRTLTRVLDLRTLLRFLTDTVLTATRAEGVAIYLLDREGFRRAAWEGHPAGSGFAAPDEAPGLVVTALTGTRDLIVTDEITRERLTDDRRRLHEELTRLDWALILPLISEQVIGAIALGPKLSGDPFYPQDLDLLMTLANQAGVAAKNAQLYAQVVLANEYISNIVATIESGVVAMDASERITLFNRAAGQLTGLSADAALDRPVTALPACLTEALRRSVAEGRALTQPEIQLSDGATMRPIICTTSPLLDPSGGVLGAVAVFSDLTPLKELEVGRRRAERLSYFEMLVSGIAHEIKNPLVAIKTFAQLLPRRQGDERFADEFGRIASREIGRMERLIERLRTLSRPNDRPRRPLDLRSPITDALETMRAAFEEKNLVVSVSLGRAPSLVLGDHAEIEQLFLNLLMNAHEAMPPRGMLSVELAMAGSRAVAVVTDTGPGVPAELLERVFEPFFTTKQRGSGLGLAICAALAQTHGATLRVANRSSGGAVFTVDFPVTLEALVPA